MKIDDLNDYYRKFKSGDEIYHQLMQKRIREILLVFTLYDAFIFEQDGQLSEQIYGEYHQMNLTSAPRITSVPTASQAVELLKEKKFDLVITMMRVGDMSPFEFARHIKENYPQLPVLLLINNRADYAILENHQEDIKYIDNIFLHNGDATLFLAMIKSVEDKLNVDNDTSKGLVRVILLVEDSIHYYSTYLPLLYEVIMKQTQKLLEEDLNEEDKRLRMRVRPKIILVKSFEDAILAFKKYSQYLLCIISDIRFIKKGQLNAKAGFDLLKRLRKVQPDLPIILQSSETENRIKAEQQGCLFIDKNDPQLLSKLRLFMRENLGFGNFVFKDNFGKIIAEADSLSSFEKLLLEIPEESLLYHSRKNHFSNWLLARGEIEIARKIKPITVEEFASTFDLREYLRQTFKNISLQRNRGKIIAFDITSLSDINKIIRLSEGSLGGKGRGLAFLNALLCAIEIDKNYENVNISLPSTAIIGTNEFDTFLASNNIIERIKDKSDEKIDEIFLTGMLSDDLFKRLKIYLENVHYPLAVRSSSLLEDSQLQPFAGVYRTFMIPNNHPDVLVRLQQLASAIKLVFASVFLSDTRNYIEALNYRAEEEKMAVIIQEVVGSNHGENYYYPHISGVAQSHNFYPTSYMEQSDGCATIALGLGMVVMEGKYNYRFCPKYPENTFLPQEEMIAVSQRSFYALDLSKTDFDLSTGEEATLTQLDLKVAEKHNTLRSLVSTLDYENQMLIDGLPSAYAPSSYGGSYGLPPHLVLTFAGILKHNHFPLAEIIRIILEIGEVALGIPVEIEFAVALDNPTGERTIDGMAPSMFRSTVSTFYILQIRPLSINSIDYTIDQTKINPADSLLYSTLAMGNGTVEDIYDIILVKPDTFDKTMTEQIRDEINSLNAILKEENRNYILMGPGRWGTRDRFLGVPVKWNDISKAKIVIEYGLKDFRIDPSQGTHFFHNLIAMNIGYFNVQYNANNEDEGLHDFINWQWIGKQKPLKDLKYTSLIRVKKPFSVKMEGKKGIALIEI